MKYDEKILKGASPVQQPCGTVLPTITKQKDSISDEKPASIGMDCNTVNTLKGFLGTTS